METYKNVNMLLYLLCVWAGLDPSQAYWISQLGSRGEAEDWIYILAVFRQCEALQVQLVQ